LFEKEKTNQTCEDHKQMFVAALSANDHPIKLVNDFSAFSFKRCHFALKSNLSTHLHAQPNAN